MAAPFAKQARAVIDDVDPQLVALPPRPYLDAPTPMGETVANCVLDQRLQ